MLRARILSHTNRIQRIPSIPTLQYATNRPRSKLDSYMISIVQSFENYRLCFAIWELRQEDTDTLKEVNDLDEFQVKVMKQNHLHQNRKYFIIACLITVVSFIYLSQN